MIWKQGLESVVIARLSEKYNVTERLYIERKSRKWK